MSTTYWVRRCDRCERLGTFSIKDPKPSDEIAYCNHCQQDTEGLWLPEGDPESDWRLTGQESYLAGITLRRMPYFRWSESWDHDHCEFCWAKFEPAGEGSSGESEEAVQHEGYTNEGVDGRRDHYWWICGDCFNDFADRFQWTTLSG